MMVTIKPTALPGRSGALLDGEISDTTDLTNPVRQIRVGRSGTLIFVTAEGDEIELENVAAGEYVTGWLIARIRLTSSGSPTITTTARNLVGVYD